MYVFVLVVCEFMSVCIYSLCECVDIRVCACRYICTYKSIYKIIFMYMHIPHSLVQYIHDSAVMSEINRPPPDSYPLNIAFAFSYNFPPFPPCTSIIRPKAIARVTSIVILLYKLQLDTDAYNCSLRYRILRVISCNHCIQCCMVLSMKVATYNPRNMVFRYRMYVYATTVSVLFNKYL